MSPVAIASALALLTAGSVLIWAGIHLYRFRPAGDAQDLEVRGWCGVLSSVVALPGIVLVGVAALVAGLSWTG